MGIKGKIYRTLGLEKIVEKIVDRVSARVSGDISGGKDEALNEIRFQIVALEEKSELSLKGMTEKIGALAEKVLCPPPLIATEYVRNGTYLGDHRALIKTKYGNKMIVPTNDIALAPHLILDGYWEEWITKFFLGLVKPGMTVLDIGANCGWYTLLACRQLEGKGMVHSFEPDPFLSDIVMDNVMINGYRAICEIHEKAVYSQSKKLPFRTMDRYKGGGKIYGASSQISSADKKNGFRQTVIEFAVQAVALDELFPGGYKVDVVKMDAEGSELPAFDGMARILKENPDIGIIVEFNPGCLKNAGKTPDDFYNFAGSFGFKLYEIKTDSTLKELSREDLTQLKTSDLYLKKP